MSRYVYIGGFGNGKASAERVTEAMKTLGASDVDPFTFAYAMDNPSKISKAVESACVITHSAGFMALKGMRMLGIDAFAAPLPTSRLHLMAKTVTKSIGMHLPHEGVRLGDVLDYDLDAIGELARHPLANGLKLGKIAKYDAIGEAVAAKHAGIDVRLWYNENDAYFNPSIEQAQAADKGLVPLIIVPGIHDQLVLDPVTQLRPAMAA